MADVFQCDKCKRLLHPQVKSGRMILQELGPDGMPHTGLYNRKAEVCRSCFEEMQRIMNATAPKPDMPQAHGIMTEASLAMIDMAKQTKKLT